MTEDQIQFISTLPGADVDGTIQTVLMSPNLDKVSFDSVLKVLVARLALEKQFLVQDNIRLSNEVNSATQ